MTQQAPAPESYIPYENSVWEWMVKTLEPDTEHKCSVLWEAPVFIRWVSPSTARKHTQGMVMYWNRTRKGFERVRPGVFKFGVKND